MKASTKWKTIERDGKSVIEFYTTEKYIYLRKPGSQRTRRLKIEDEAHGRAIATWEAQYAQ